MRLRNIDVFTAILVILVVSARGSFADDTVLTKMNPSPSQHREEWTEWRGGPMQGRSELSVPREWSTIANLRWVYAIPGRGTSSPIVKDDLVIVTTSYLAQRASHFRTGISALLLLLSGTALYFGSLVIHRRLKQPGGWQNGVGVGSFASTLALLILLVIFGSAILDFDRCPIRSWLGGSVILTLGLLLALTCCPRRSSLRPIIGLFALGLSLLVVQGLPSKDHAFRSGWFASSAWVVYTIGALPLSTGLISIVQSFVCRQAGWRRQLRVCCVWAAILSLLVNAALGSRIVSAGIDASHPDGNPDGILLLPAFAWLLLTSVWTLHGLALSIDLSSRGRGVASSTPRGRMVVAVLAIVGTTATTAIGVHLLTTQGLYLPYHLPIRRIDPRLGWQACFVMWGCVCGALAVTLPFRSIPELPCVRAWFQFCVVSLGIIAFVSENLLKKEQVLTRAIIAVDRDSGEFRWACEALHKPERPLHRYNSPASATPVIKDGRVFAYFGSAGVMCSDLMGRLVWTNEDVIFHGAYGAGASPCIADGVMVIVNGMPDEAYVCGLDGSNGQLLWRQSMRGQAVSGNSRTPIVEKLNGKMAALVWGFEGLTGLDVTSGKELFHYDIGNGGGDQVSTIVKDGEFLFCIGAAEAISLRMNHLGNAREAPIVWKRKMQSVNCASPVIANGRAFCVTDAGVASCIELETGAILWRRRLSGSYYASPVICGDLVYFTNLDGVTAVIEASASFNLVAENSLPGQFLASPAPVDGQIFIRSGDRLYCISGHTEPRTGSELVRNDGPRLLE